MKRLLVLATAASLALTACSTGAVATVDGRPITADEVAALYIDGDTIETQIFSDSLYSLILNDIITSAAEAEWGLSVTPEELDAEIAELESQFALQGSTLAAELEARNLATHYLDVFGAQTVLQDKIGNELVGDATPPTEDEMRDVYDAQLQARSEVCASHILVETEEEATAVFERLDGGEAFADLASELSLDPGSGAAGGELGCTTPNQYVPEFAIATLEADLDDPYGPVQSQFGYHIILVTDRTVPEFESLRDELAEQIQAASRQGLVQGWIVEVVRAAEVTVDEQYGVWVVPEDPTQPPTLQPAP